MTEITNEMRQAAATLGRMGGRAGTGASKRRSPAVIAKAVAARIKANKKRIAKRNKDAKAQAKLDKLNAKNGGNS